MKEMEGNMKEREIWGGEKRHKRGGLRQKIGKICIWDGIIRNISVWDGIIINIIEGIPVPRASVAAHAYPVGRPRGDGPLYRGDECV